VDPIQILILTLGWIIAILAVAKYFPEILGIKPMNLADFLIFSQLFLMLIEAVILTISCRSWLFLLVVRYAVTPLLSANFLAIGIYSSYRAYFTIIRRRKAIAECLKYPNSPADLMKFISVFFIPLYLILPLLSVAGSIAILLDNSYQQMVMAISSLIVLCFSLEGLKAAMGESPRRMRRLWKWVTTLERGDPREILLNIILPYATLSLIAGILSEPLYEFIQLIVLGPPFSVLSVIFVRYILIGLKDGIIRLLIMLLLCSLIVSSSSSLLLASGKVSDLIYFQIVFLASVNKHLIKRPLLKEFVNLIVILLFLLIILYTEYIL
jgi:hypothetical protein